jgi:hypothetical protein
MGQRVHRPALHGSEHALVRQLRRANAYLQYQQRLVE